MRTPNVAPYEIAYSSVDATLRDGHQIVHHYVVLPNGWTCSILNNRMHDLWEVAAITNDPDQEVVPEMELTEEELVEAIRVIEQREPIDNPLDLDKVRAYANQGSGWRRNFSYNEETQTWEYVVASEWL